MSPTSAKIPSFYLPSQQRQMWTSETQIERHITSHLGSFACLLLEWHLFWNDSFMLLFRSIFFASLLLHWSTGLEDYALAIRQYTCTLPEIDLPTSFNGLFRLLFLPLLPGLDVASVSTMLSIFLQHDNSYFRFNMATLSFKTLSDFPYLIKRDMSVLSLTSVIYSTWVFSDGAVDHPTWCSSRASSYKRSRWLSSRNGATGEISKSLYPNRVQPRIGW